MRNANRKCNCLKLAERIKQIIECGIRNCTGAKTTTASVLLK